MATRAMLYIDAFKAALELMQAHVLHHPPRFFDVDASRISRGLVTTCSEIKDMHTDDQTPDAPG